MIADYYYPDPAQVPGPSAAASTAVGSVAVGASAAAAPSSSSTAQPGCVGDPAMAAHYNSASSLGAATRYRRLEKIGEGSYGKVYKCEDQVTKRVVAIKVISWNANDEGVPASAIREVSLLREIQHPNVVPLFDVVPDDSRLMLVFEFLDKDLKRLLDQRATPLVGRKLKVIMYQLLSGLHSCHSRRIVHRDIKPNNILVTRDEGTVKLADFGLGRAFCLPLQTYTREVITLYYRAPEILLGERHYLPSVDMWSMGCVFAELAMGKPVFPGETEIAQLIAIFQVMGTPNETLWPGVSLLPHYNTEFPQWKPSSLASAIPSLEAEGVELLQMMLRYTPQQRITAYQALQHPYFDEVRVVCESQIQEELARARLS